MARVVRLDPLWRRAFGFPARQPVWSLVVAVAVFAFAAASATAPLVSDAAADRSFAAEAAAAATSASVGQGLDARAYSTGLTDPAAVDGVSGLLDELPVVGAPIVSVTPLLPYADRRQPRPVVRNAAGDEVTAVVASLGDAVAALAADPATTAGTTGDAAAADGVWVPDTVARSLHLAVGDPVELELSFPTPGDAPEVPVVAGATVAGIYVTIDGLPAAGGVDWRSPLAPVPSQPLGEQRPAAVLFAAPATALALIDAMGDTSFVKWTMPWEGEPTLSLGREAAPAIRSTALVLQNTESVIAKRVAEGGGRTVLLSSGVRTFVERAVQAADTLGPVVRSVALTAQVLALMVLVVSVRLLARQRAPHHQLALSAGMRPSSLGFLAALELLVPIVLAVGLAAAVVRWQPDLVAGDGAIGADVLRRAWHTTIRALPVCLALVIITTTVSVWPLEPGSARRATWLANAVRADTVVVVAAVVTGAQLLSVEGTVLDSGISLLFPLLAVLAGSMIVVRLLGGIVALAARRRRGRPVDTASLLRPPRSVVWWMARRRLRFSVSQLGTLAVVIATGVGLFVYCVSITTNGERGLADKITALGGARATLPVRSTDHLALGDDAFPTDLAPGRTVVWAATSVHVGSNLATDLLAVDRRTFASAAEWGDSFAGPSLPDLLDLLAGSRAGVADIVVAGHYTDRFPDRGSLDLGGGYGSVPYHVVARIAAAPWQRERASMAIVLADVLAPLVPGIDGKLPGPSTAAALDRIMRTYVWSSEPQSSLNAAYETIALDDTTPNVPSASRTPSFVAYSLSLPYVRVVGVGLLVVALVSITVLGARRRAEMALELAMTDRMGMRRSTVGAALVSASVAVGLLGSLIGLLIARSLVAYMTARLDPGPSFAPPFEGRLDMAAVAIAVGSVLAASVLGTVFEVVGARRVPVVEVLRATQ